MSLRIKLLAPVLLLSATAVAQQKFSGMWQGVLNAGRPLHMAFHIKDSTAATLDVLEQNVKDFAASGVNIIGDSIHINFSKLSSSYKGVITGTDVITGSWNQAGRSFPMEIRRNEKPAELNRPQTPRAPFAYNSEDVTFKSADKKITYGATLTVPKGNGPFPAVLLISGSGRQNRDEEVFGHKPFAVIADHLTKSGYAVLRVDDRGIGQTTGGDPGLTSADFVKDAAAALDYLKTRKEVDKKKIGMAGHSEGGMIAQMLATERADIDFIVLLAGPGIKATDLMMEQNGAILRANGAKEEVVTAYLELYKNIAEGVVAAKTKADVKTNVAGAIKKWREHTDPQIVMATTGISDNTSEEVVSEKIAQQFMDPWLRYFLAYDPKPYLEKMEVKVLALNGEKDVQVISKSNLNGMEMGLSKSKSKQYNVMEVPGLNHLFQECKQCTVAEYAQLEETFSPSALLMITEWLDKYVKQN